MRNIFNRSFCHAINQKKRLLNYIKQLNSPLSLDLIPFISQAKCNFHSYWKLLCEFTNRFEYFCKKVRRPCISTIILIMPEPVSCRTQRYHLHPKITFLRYLMLFHLYRFLCTRLSVVNPAATLLIRCYHYIVSFL